MKLVKDNSYQLILIAKHLKNTEYSGINQKVAYRWLLQATNLIMEGI